MNTPNIAAAGDALMASLAPTLPTPLETELSDKLSAARRRCEALERENERLRSQSAAAALRTIAYLAELRPLRRIAARIASAWRSGAGYPDDEMEIHDAIESLERHLASTVPQNQAPAEGAAPEPGASSGASDSIGTVRQTGTAVGGSSILQPPTADWRAVWIDGADGGAGEVAR